MIDLDRHAIAKPIEGPYLWIVHDLILKAKAKTVFEIGSGYFSFSRAILKALEQTGGILHTCDPLIRTQYSHPQMKFYNIKSDQMAQRWTIPLDTLMIDGHHSYNQVYKDFNNFYPHVKPGGIIIFHDINAPGAPGVKQLWTELKPWHKITAEYLHYLGLGVIQK